MTESKRNVCWIVSIMLGIVSVTVTAFINYQIAREYLRVDRKSQLLFGIKELLQFGYQYYVIVLSFIALVLAVFYATGKNQKPKKSASAIGLSVLAIAIVFMRIWRLFVY